MRTLLALTVTVLCITSVDVGAETELPELLATLNFDRKEALVKEQILLTLRVGYPPGAFGMSQTSLEASNAELLSLQKSESIEIHNGLRYRFVQTDYALFANSEGRINLSPMRFDALLPVSSGGSDSKSNPQISAVIQSKSINIYPAPVTPPVNTNRIVPQHWLAATNVTIKSLWASKKETLVPGVPVQRKIVIHIEGQHPAAVTESLDMQIPVGLRIYPEAAIRETEKNQHGLSGTITLPFTLVAGVAGTYDLPEITLPWWDINQRKWRKAVLSSETLRITSSAHSTPKRYRRAALALLALLIAGTCLLYLFSLLFRGNHTGPPLSEKQAWRRVRKSVRSLKPCNHHEYHELRAALQYWALTVNSNNPAVNVEYLAENYPPSRLLLSAIDQSLYGRSQGPPLSKRHILKILTEMRENALIKNKNQVVNRGLYPENIAQ